MALKRTTSNQVVAGVCGGLAREFNIDVVPIRLIFIILTLAGILPGVLLYLVLWIVMPEDDEESS